MSLNVTHDIILLSCLKREKMISRATVMFFYIFKTSLYIPLGILDIIFGCTKPPSI